MRDPRETGHRLYLLRHAKSSWGDAGLADHDRPLAPRGEKAAREVAEHARKRGIEPALVLCSTAVRARQTLAAFSFAGDVSYEDGLYGANAGDLVARLRRLPEGLPEAMIVAHNPGLQELLLLLIGERGASALARLRDKLPTGALVTLGFRGPWAALGEARATLEDLVVPAEL